VWTVHNLVNHERVHEREEAMFARYLSALSDRIIVHGAAAKERVVNACHVDPARVQVIPHGTYAGYYKNDVSRDDARRKLGIDTGSFVFLFFGQMRTYKGLTDLIRAFERADLPNAKLVIAGNPRSERNKSDLRALCRGNGSIILDDRFIPDDEIQNYMNASDAVVLPYQDVLTSGAGVLAMSFSRAMVLPDLCCVPDFADGEGSVVYDPADPDGLTRAMERVMSRDTGGMGAHNYDRAQRMGWDRVGELTSQAYSN